MKSTAYIVETALIALCGAYVAYQVIVAVSLYLEQVKAATEAALGG